MAATSTVRLRVGWLVEPGFGPIDHEVARYTASQMLGGDPGAFGFRPLYERILREQPDFLE